MTKSFEIETRNIPNEERKFPIKNAFEFVNLGFFIQEYKQTPTHRLYLTVRHSVEKNLYGFYHENPRYVVEALRQTADQIEECLQKYES